MAFQHLQFNEQLQHGRLLRQFLLQTEAGLDGLNKIRDTMTLMIDGNGSDASQFTEVINRFGFPDGAAAKGAWDELNSFLGKLNTDAQVSSVHAATVQLLNKLR